MNLFQRIKGKILQEPKRRFVQLIKKHNLHLYYIDNKDVIGVLDEVFEKEIYGLQFPKNEGATIVDVGAHFGLFTLFAHQNSSADSKIYCLEPSAENCVQLAKNLKLNQVGNAQIIKKALAGSTGKQILYQGKSVNHSLVTDYPLTDVDAKSVAVETITLHDFIKTNNIDQIDFLKLDCEGSEYDMLFNTTGETLQKVKVISCEFHDIKSETKNGEELKCFLQEKGFEIVRFEYLPSNMGLVFGMLVAINLACAPKR